ncbi:hypothetical protein CN380_19350 [Bacillus sp. AFS017274]|nr:hypothetical protein CN380_19350 [Bacillus sp. AFS017274]
MLSRIRLTMGMYLFQKGLIRRIVELERLGEEWSIFLQKKCLVDKKDYLKIKQLAIGLLKKG